MKTSILVSTYGKDLPFFRGLLASYRKFCRGFAEFVVVVPHPDVAAFREVVGPDRHVQVFGFHERAGKGMLHHQVQICRADEWCEGDFILHLDSDCIFWRDTEPKDFFQGGRPILWFERFDNFKATHPNRYRWRRCVTDALGYDPQVETMVRHPAVHPRDLYRQVREQVERFTMQRFDEYVLGCRNEYPQSFAEFPTLGGFAYLFRRADYSWQEKTGPEDYVYRVDRDHITAFWSHAGFDQYADQVREILAQPNTFGNRV